MIRDPALGNAVILDFHFASSRRLKNRSESPRNQKIGRCEFEHLSAFVFAVAV